MWFVASERSTAVSTQTNETIDLTGQRALPEVSRSEARAGGGDAFGFGPDGRPAAATAASADELVDGPWLDAILARSTSRVCS
jgi:hypothetical protein